jgi:hypothetical protein
LRRADFALAAVRRDVREAEPVHDPAGQLGRHDAAEFGVAAGDFRGVVLGDRRRDLFRPQLERSHPQVRQPGLPLVDLVLAVVRVPRPRQDERNPELALEHLRRSL